MLLLEDGWRISANERALVLERTTAKGLARVGYYASAETALAVPADTEHGGERVKRALAALAELEKQLAVRLAENYPANLPSDWRIQAKQHNPGTLQHLVTPDPTHHLTKDGAESTWVDVGYYPSEAMAIKVLARRLVREALELPSADGMFGVNVIVEFRMGGADGVMALHRARREAL